MLNRRRPDSAIDKFSLFVMMIMMRIRIRTYVRTYVRTCAPVRVDRDLGHDHDDCELVKY